MIKLGIRTRTFLLVTFVALLASCSAIKLGYNNSASIAQTYLNSKVDFDTDQTELLQTSLNEIVQWHRNKELPQLANELKAARLALLPKDGILEPISASQVQALNTAIRASLRRTANEAAPVISRNMLRLKTSQIQEIQDALDKSNEEYREERLLPNPKSRLKQATERMEERFERWLGKLSRGQRLQIEAWAQAEAYRAEPRYQKRLERQKQFMNLVRQSVSQQIDHAKLSEEIAKLLNGWQTPTSAEEKQDIENRQQSTIALVLDILNMATADQRNEAAELAGSWAKDFQILASTN